MTARAMFLDVSVPGLAPEAELQTLTSPPVLTVLKFDEHYNADAMHMVAEIWYRAVSGTPLETRCVILPHGVEVNMLDQNGQVIGKVA